MPWYDRFLPGASAARVEPSFRHGLRAASMDAPVSFDDLTDPALADYLRGGSQSASGVAVTDMSAMQSAVAWRCTHLICGVTATLPADLVTADVDQSHKPAVNHPFREVLRTKPNPWQTPGEFKRMLQAHKLLRGNGYAFKVKSRGAVRGLIPLVPSRMRPIQNDDLSITYHYTQRNGGTADFDQGDIFHLRGLSLDGVTGLSTIAYARETFGLAQAAERAGANLFNNGHFTSGYLKTAQALSENAFERLKTGINEKRGVRAENAAGIQILEEGLEYQASSLSAEDAQWLQTRGFQRGDIGMFFGVPPFLYGDTEKQTSWGTGIQQLNLMFKQYCLADHITAWRETYKRDCLSNPGDDPNLVVHFDWNDFLQADSAAMADYFSKALGQGVPWMRQNEVRGNVHLPPSSEPHADVLPASTITIRQTVDTKEPPPGVV